MRRWALVIVLLYGLILVVSTLPLLSVIQISFSDFKSASSLLVHIKEQLNFLQEWSYWLTIVVVMLAQAALLMIPVDISAARPVKKMPVALTILVTALMMGLLAGGAVLTVAEVINKDFLGWAGPIFLGAMGALWLMWAVIFWRWSRRLEPQILLEKQCHYLYRGSVLELFIAVPAHIYVRQRNECCAGFGTFYGIACGLAVMLFSFGPGVFFLYAERIRALRQRWKK